MVNTVLVRRKLMKLDGYLAELKHLSRYTFEDYCSDFRTKRAVERLLQLLSDVATDINMHIIVDERFPPPPDSFQSFVTLARLEVFPEEFAYQIAPATGERNILVHEYEQIDDRVVYDSISEALELFSRYAGYVQAFLNRRENSKA